MSRIVDNLIAYRIVKMLVTPFIETEAYKLGIIDAHGKNLKKANQLDTTQEKDAYDYLTRLVFNMKKIINRLPGGESRLKSLVAALWLIREQYESGRESSATLQEKFVSLVEMMDNRVSLVEEEIIVNKVLEEDGIANVTGAAVSTDEPKIMPNDIKKYKSGQGMTIAGMVRRPKPVK